MTARVLQFTVICAMKAVITDLRAYLQLGINMRLVQFYTRSKYQKCVILTFATT